MAKAFSPLAPKVIAHPINVAPVGLAQTEKAISLFGLDAPVAHKREARAWLTVDLDLSFL